MISFPIRIGCVDMGSNAIRFVAAKFSSMSDFEVLVSDRRPIRLGHGVYLSGRLDSLAMDATVAAMAEFKTSCDTLDLHAFRAVATSAVRESRNGEELVSRIREKTSVELDVISGSEEAALVHLAVSQSVILGDGQWLLVDLGGGSVEVSMVNREGILWSESHTLGSVRLLEELTETGNDPGRFRRLLSEYVAAFSVASAEGMEPPFGYIATGGNIDTLAKLAGDHSTSGEFRLSLKTLDALIERLASMSYQQRVTVLGLREDRADVILPAAMVYRHLGEIFGCDEILVPHVGIKEGVMFDLVDKVINRAKREDRRSREIHNSALNLGRKYHFNAAHAEQVTRLSLSLFDQLEGALGFHIRDRKILHAAAMLHNIGYFVSPKGHHKHSMYLISYSELPNFSALEMRLVAQVARYHRKSEPAPRHLSYMSLTETNRERVRRLSALLRITAALDRDHQERVKRISARTGPGEIIITLEGQQDVLLEAWSLKRNSHFFSKVFDRSVRVEHLSA